MTLLQLDSVSWSVWRGQAEIPVLRDVSLDIHPGGLVAVYGQRGAGKTTLLEIAAGLEAPDRGRVRFEGRDLAGLSRTALARLHRNEIGWVERGGPRVPDLATQLYVALPLYRSVRHEEARRRAGTALRRVGADDYADQLWDDLPDAARVLVAIAHALVREPRLIVVDDPTAGLDITEREAVVGLLRSAAEHAGLGVLMAVPDMPSMLQAHDVRLLTRGRLVAPSDPDGGGGTVLPFPGDRRPA